MVLLLQENEGLDEGDADDASREINDSQPQVIRHQEKVILLGNTIKNKSTKFPPLHTNSNF